MSQDNDTPEAEDPQAPVPNGDGPGEDFAVLRAEAEAQRDRAMRALAEVENVRKRLERERDESRVYAVTRFARDLLTVADNLNRALSSFPPEARTRLDETFRAVLDGVEATERELQATLARHGIKSIEAQGQRFDPHLHQAIAEVPAGSAEPGTVVTVVQSGYTIGDRLLRPAMVTVAKGQPAVKPPGEGGATGTFDTKV